MPENTQPSFVAAIAVIIAVAMMLLGCRWQFRSATLPNTNRSNMRVLRTEVEFGVFEPELQPGFGLKWRRSYADFPSPLRLC
jgi:hypothetical protein